MKYIPEVLQRGAGEIATRVAETVRVATELPWVIAPWMAGSHEGEAINTAEEIEGVVDYMRFEHVTIDNFDQYVHDMQQRMQELKGYFDNQSVEWQDAVANEVNQIYLIVGGLLSTLRGVKSDKRVQTDRVLPFDSNKALAEQSKKLSGHFKKLNSYCMNTDFLLGSDFQCDMADLENEVSKIIAKLCDSHI